MYKSNNIAPSYMSLFNFFASLESRMSGYGRMLRDKRKLLYKSLCSHDRYKVEHDSTGGKKSLCKHLF